MDYYNTTKLAGPGLKESTGKAKKQKDQILALFKGTRRPMSPATIWEHYGFKEKNVPITSVRRAITNLEKDGFLTKTDIQEDGIYGKKNFCWVYREPKQETDQGSLF